MGMLAERVIAFRPEIARLLGSIEAALLYQQLFYWSDKGGREDGWFYKSAREIEDETSLTTGQQRSARAKLVKAGWIEAKNMRANNHGTLHYRCLQQLTTVVTPSLLNSQSNSLSESQNYKVAENDKLIDVQNSQSIKQEITTEITQKTTTYTAEDVRLVNKLFDSVRQRFPYLNEKPPKATAYQAINRLHRVDGYPYAAIELVMDWALQDDFWCDKIRAAAPFRRKFNTLLVQAKRQQETKKNLVVVI